MKLLGMKVAEYWHVEIFVAVPFIVWFIWRIETIVHILKTCSAT